VIAMIQSARASLDSDCARIAESIERDGFAEVRDFVSPEAITQARESIEAAVRSNGNETIGRIRDLGQFDDTFVGALTRDRDFVRLCRGIYAAAYGGPAPEAELVPSLRCLSGKSGHQQSMIFHYDSYVLTAIVPVIIPEEGRRGRLIVCPNTRPIRRTYLGNFLDKLLSDRKRSQRRYRELYESRSARLRYIDVEPGSIYFFWGYRSIHTNEPCDPDKIRSTAIYHYYDPHLDNSFKKLLRLRYLLRK
jgi:hypothetical protein